MQKPGLSVGNGQSSPTDKTSKRPEPTKNRESIDRKAERRLIWKCDLHVLPPIAFLYMLAFIDRINIGNARIQGLEKSLNMKGQDFNIALCVFFPLYIMFEVPSNLLLRKIAPSLWLSFLMAAWGEALIIRLICGHPADS